MYNVANWADDVAANIPWSYGLHFINVMQVPCNAGQCSFLYSRDCVEDQCVAGAIMNYTDLLSQALVNELPSTAAQALVADESLRFLIHYMGDVHQPLHAARNEDRGGNSINVTFYVPGQGTEWNLHNVWDFGMVVRSINESFGGSQELFTLSLLKELQTYTTEDVDAWVACITALSPGDISGLQGCIEEWVQESLDLALTDAYYDENGREFENGDTISNEYWRLRMIPVRERLIKSGVRLAAVAEFVYSLAA